MLGRERISNQAGFSFIELLIVVVLIGIIGIITSQMFILNIRSQGQSEILKEVKQSGDFAIAAMEGMVRNAADIPESSCNSNSQTFSIVSQDGNTTTFDCSDVQIASISADLQPPVSQPLTSSKVQVSSCNFRVVCPTPALSPKYVYIDFILSQPNPDVAIADKSQEEFETTVSLRNYQ